LPAGFTCCIAFTSIKPPYPQGIGEHVLSNLKADFVFLLVYSVFGFVPGDLPCK
jgi:hypothetical protein